MPTAEEQQIEMKARHLALQQEDPVHQLAPLRAAKAGFEPAQGQDKGREILSHLYDDEPFFVFRAKDILSSFGLDRYAELVEKFDPQSEHLKSLTDRIIEFRYWQKANPDKIKLPD